MGWFPNVHFCASVAWLVGGCVYPSVCDLDSGPLPSNSEVVVLSHVGWQRTILPWQSFLPGVPASCSCSWSFAVGTTQWNQVEKYTGRICFPAPPTQRLEGCSVSSSPQDGRISAAVGNASQMCVSVASGWRPRLQGDGKGSRLQ